MNDPAKLISIMKVMLSELERSLSGVSQPVDEDNDAATSNLKSRIDRLEAVLKKREDHLHRQRELEKQNRQNARPAKSR
jgi:prefoldin subunit 5